MRKPVLVVSAIGLGIAMLVLAARYARRVGGDLGPQGTIQLVSNPLPLPGFSATTLDGKRISNADLKGKVGIVNFWATWCGPCREEIPDFVKLQERYRDDLLIIGLSIDEVGEQAVREFAAQYGINYPVAIVTPELRGVFGRVYSIPTSFVVDREGAVVQKHVGLISPAIYEQEIRALAGLPVNVRIERIVDTGQVMLKNAAHAVEIPGLDLSGLTPDQRRRALQRLNTDKCTCGCGYTLAECRINDAACDVSLPLAKKLVEEVRGKS